MAKETKKHRSQVIEQTIQNAVNGWSIPMMKVGAVYKAGESVATAAPAVAIEELIPSIQSAVTAKLQEVAQPQAMFDTGGFNKGLAAIAERSKDWKLGEPKSGQNGYGF